MHVSGKKSASSPVYDPCRRHENKEVGRHCLSVNSKYNKKQDRAANITLNSDSILDQLPYSREILHSGCTNVTLEVTLGHYCR